MQHLCGKCGLHCETQDKATVIKIVASGREFYLTWNVADSAKVNFFGPTFKRHESAIRYAVRWGMRHGGQFQLVGLAGEDYMELKTGWVKNFLDIELAR